MPFLSNYCFVYGKVSWAFAVEVAPVSAICGILVNVCKCAKVGTMQCRLLLRTKTRWCVKAVLRGFLQDCAVADNASGVECRISSARFPHTRLTSQTRPRGLKQPWIKDDPALCSDFFRDTQRDSLQVRRCLRRSSGVKRKGLVEVVDSCRHKTVFSASDRVWVHDRRARLMQLLTALARAVVGRLICSSFVDQQQAGLRADSQNFVVR